MMSKMEKSIMLTLIFMSLFLGIANTNKTSKLIPYYGSQMANQTVRVGKKAHFNCNVKDIGGNKVAFAKDDRRTVLVHDGDVVNEDKRLEIRRSGGDFWNLQIGGIEEGDEGNYRCQVNRNPAMVQSAYLHVLVPPFILDDPPSSATVQEGGTAKLICKATGIPPPNVTWRKELRPNAEDFHAGEMLEFPTANRKQRGTYFCVAANGVPAATARMMTLTVHFKPTVKVKNDLISSSGHADVLLECIVESLPKGSLQWKTKSGEVIDRNDTAYEIIQTEMSDITTKFDLIVRNLNENNTGAYYCHASNALGESENSVHVYVSYSLVSENRTCDCNRTKCHLNVRNRRISPKFFNVINITDENLDNCTCPCPPSNTTMTSPSGRILAVFIFLIFIIKFIDPVY